MTAGCEIGWMRDLGTNARPALQVILPYLTSTNTGLARTAAYTLGGLKTGTEICIPALSYCLHSADAQVRAAAAVSLMGFGPEAWLTRHEIGAVLNEDRAFGRARMNAWLRRNGAN